MIQPDRAIDGQKAKLSVILTSYNYARYVGQALSGIASQSFKNFELVVVDGCSTDNSIDIFEASLNDVPGALLLRNERNLGALDSAEAGLARSSAHYVYYASADDRVLAGFFERSMEMLAAYLRAGLCCSDAVYFDDATGYVGARRMPFGPCSRFLTPDELADAFRQRLFYIYGHTCVVKRTSLLEAGGLVRELAWLCDWFASLVIGFRHGICYVPEPLAAMRTHATSYSASASRSYDAQRRVLNHLLQLLRSPAYGDVARLFRQSEVLASLGMPMLKVLLENPENRDFLSLRLARRIILGEATNRTYSTVARLSPESAKRAYRRLRFEIPTRLLTDTKEARRSGERGR